MCRLTNEVDSLSRIVLRLTGVGDYAFRRYNTNYLVNQV